MSQPCAKWLRSETHEKFADAMMKCQHPFAICAQDGRCHYGDCFSRRRGRDSVEARIKRLEDRVAILEALR